MQQIRQKKLFKFTNTPNPLYKNQFSPRFRLIILVPTIFSIIFWPISIIWTCEPKKVKVKTPQNRSRGRVLKPAESPARQPISQKPVFYMFCNFMRKFSIYYNHLKMAAILNLQVLNYESLTLKMIGNYVLHSHLCLEITN